MTPSTKKLLLQLAATSVAAFIGAAGLYLATRQETSVAAEQVKVEYARTAIERDREDREAWEALLRNLTAEVARLTAEVEGLRADNGRLRKQVLTLTGELAAQRLVREAEAEQAATRRAAPQTLEPRSLKVEPEPDSEATERLPKRF